MDGPLNIWTLMIFGEAYEANAVDISLPQAAAEGVGTIQASQQALGLLW